MVARTLVLTVMAAVGLGAVALQEAPKGDPAEERVAMVDTPKDGKADLRRGDLVIRVELDEKYRPLAATLNKGDIVVVTWDNPAKPAAVKSFGLLRCQTGTKMRVGLLVGSALLIIVLGVVCSLNNPLRFVLGKDNRYSNSKFQASIWFMLLMSAYIATLILRLTCLKSDIAFNIGFPPHLLALSGLSALTFAGAKAITVGQEAAKVKAKAEGKALAHPEAKTKAAEASFPGDLVRDDDGNLDVGDFQLVVVTLVAAAAYAVQIYLFLGTTEGRVSVELPDVSTTLLAGVGVGQGAYLAKKYAGHGA